MHTRSADGQTGKKAESVLKVEIADDDVKKVVGEEDHSKDHEDVEDAEPETGDTDHAESLRRKRDREGSIEPSLTPSKQESIPTKKNRLQSDTVAEEPTALSSSSPPLPSTALGSVEGEKVGQIRKRVEDLSWKQRKEGDRDRLEPEGTEEEVKTDTGKVEAETIEVSTDKGDTPVKTSQPTFASFAKSKGFARAEPNSSPSTSTSATAQASARTQPTFSSFSKSSSPFGSASANIAGPSWLAGKASSSGSSSSAAIGGGGLKPSTLGSMPGSEQGTPATTSATKSVSPPPSAIKAGGGLGFGAFASSNAFTKAASSRSSTPLSAAKEDGSSSPGDGLAAAPEKPAAPKSFDEALREGELKEDGEVKGNKVETQFDKGQADLRTGEEDEVSLASIRAKLFTMGDDKTWKERGTGTVRCNVDRSAYESERKAVGARLVMRSEGVLRLILNVKLFKGMKANLEQDKFLRMVAFEDGKATHFAIRMGNAAAASQFTQTVQSLIPKEDANGVASKEAAQDEA